MPIHGDEAEIYLVEETTIYGTTISHSYFTLDQVKRSWPALKGKLNRESRWAKNISSFANNIVEMFAFKLEFDHQKNKIIWSQIDHYRAP